jgi:hypothetical protein
MLRTGKVVFAQTLMKRHCKYAETKFALCQEMKIPGSGFLQKKSMRLPDTPV